MRLGNSLLGVMDSHTGSPRHVLNELPVGLLSSLQSLSVLLTSCENTLTNIGYLSKIENLKLKENSVQASSQSAPEVA